MSRPSPRTDWTEVSFLSAGAVPQGDICAQRGGRGRVPNRAGGARRRGDRAADGVRSVVSGGGEQQRPAGAGAAPPPLRTNRTRRVLHPVLIGHAPPSPRTNRTRRVLHPVLIGHAGPAGEGAHGGRPAGARREPGAADVQEAGRRGPRQPEEACQDERGMEGDPGRGGRRETRGRGRGRGIQRRRGGRAPAGCGAGAGAAARGRGRSGHGAGLPPSRTEWTRLVTPSVLIGHVSSLPPY
jgi:hypothetical protein